MVFPNMELARRLERAEGFACARAWMRFGDDGGGGRERVAEECGEAGVQGGVYAGEVEADGVSYWKRAGRSRPP